MSTIKTITQMNKVDVEQIIRQMPKRLRAYVSDYVKTNMPERIYEFALSYMLEDLAEQAEAKQKANEQLPEMSESDDDDALPEMSESDDDDALPEMSESDDDN